MNQRQKNKQYMFRKVINHLKEHNDIYENEPLVMEVVHDFAIKVEEVERLLALEYQYSLPIAEIRDAEREVFNQVIGSLAGFVQAIAVRQGQLNEANLAALSARDLMYCTLQSTISKARSILDLAFQYQPVLHKYPTTTLLLAQAQDQLASFDERILSPMERIDRRRQLLAAINRIQGEIMDLLRQQLDQVLRLYAVSHASFHTAYRNLRVIPKIKGRGQGFAQEAEDIRAAVLPEYLEKTTINAAAMVS